MDLMTFEDSAAVTIKDEELEFRKDFFYNKEADTTVRFYDGKTLRFNKTALVVAANSKILYEVFFGSLKDVDVTEILNCEHDDFKLFLDCAMGFEKYTLDNSFKIFQIVWKYQIQNLIEKCINSLKPTVVNKRTCEILNMAAFLSCDVLVKQTRDFINRNCNFYKFFEDFCNILKPDAMKVMLTCKYYFIDSQILEELLLWGNNFIRNNDTGCETLPIFLIKYELLQFFKLKQFETTGAMAKFCLSEAGKNLFSAQQILTYLQNPERELLHGQSEWKKIKSCEFIVDEITVHPTIKLYSNSLDCIILLIKIERNRIVVYDKQYSDNLLVSCKVNFCGKDSKGVKFIKSTKEFIFNADTLTTKYTYYIGSKDLYLRGLPSSNKDYTIKLTWTFLRNGRVLLTNTAGGYGLEKMCFAKKVSVNILNSIR